MEGAAVRAVIRFRLDAVSEENGHEYAEGSSMRRLHPEPGFKADSSPSCCGLCRS